MKTINKKELKTAIKEWKALGAKQEKIFQKFCKKYKLNKEAEEWAWEFFGWSCSIEDSQTLTNLKVLGYEIK